MLQVGRIAQQMRSKAKRKRLQEDPNNPLPRLPTENSRAGKSKWGNADQKRKRNSAHYVVLQKLWKLGLPSKGRNPVMLRRVSLLTSGPGIRRLCKHCVTDE